MKSQIEQLAAEYKMQKADVKQTFQREQEHLEADRSKIREQVAKIDGLLAHLDGSLYKWLCENTEGWENTIGKVVDEERVLYAEGLEPRLSGASDGLFGIQLNLDNIDSVHRTPDEYRAEKKRLEEQVQQLERQLAQLLAKHEDEMAKLRKKYAALINPLRQSATLLKVEEEQIPGKRQELQIQRHKLEMEEQEEIDRETEVRQRACNDAVLKVQSEKEAREKNELKNRKELKDLDSAFDKASKALDAELRAFKASQNVEAAARNQEFADQKKQLDKQQNEELAGKGVDTHLLEQYRKELDDLQGLLKRIDKERPIVIRYRDAEKNLFAVEPEIKESMKAIERQLSSIRQHYDDKRERILRRCAELDESQKKLLKELEHRCEGLERYRQMLDNEHLVPDTYLSDEKTMKTQQDCQQLLSQLRGVVNQKRESIEQLKSVVVSFNRNFKPQNAFHFNTMPVTDADYMLIAVDLQDFMDNNKIEEFRRRTSEHYKDIMGRISAEIGSLMKRRADVDGVIQDINRDFVEKNFAGVIKSIELRADASSDKLMQLLISIHDYTMENALTIGELNLFSDNNQDEVNRKVVDYLKSLSHQLQNEPNRAMVSLGDAFRLQFRVKELSLIHI